jgi:ankyrin repeat protein
MKIILISIILSSGLNLNFDKTNSDLLFYSCRIEKSQPTIEFLIPFSDKIKLLDKVDFSFYVNQSVISQYRYKIEVSAGLIGVVADELTAWSEWKSDYSINIRTQTFDKEGKCKFLVEYKLLTTNETKLFEKPFEVKWENPEVREDNYLINTEFINSGSGNAEKLKRSSDEYKKMYDEWNDKFKKEYKKLGLSGQSPELLINLLAESIIKSSKSVLVNAVGKEISARQILKPEIIQELIQNGNSDLITIYRNPEANSGATMAAVSNAASFVFQEEYKKSLNNITEKTSAPEIIPPVIAQVVVPQKDLQTESKEVVSTRQIETAVIAEVKKVADSTAAIEKNVKKVSETTAVIKPEIKKEEVLIDYNKMLLESISQKNNQLFTQSVNNGANTNIKGNNGENIFHIIAGKISDEKVIPVLIKKRNSINKPDNYGNTPLHYAILSGETEYSKLLLKYGAEVYTKNQQDMSPLHLAALVNNREIVKELLAKGANVNISGNSGYTPLHIAAEMNYTGIANDLLFKDANKKIKTNQKLNPATIAGIQNNNDMKKLIKKGGSYSFNPVQSTLSPVSVKSSSATYPQIDFKLPYDQELVKKRQFNKLIQRVSVPVFAVSAAGALFFRSKANGYYSDYKKATNATVAKNFYDKSGRYDTYALISVTVSAGSIYGFIHSTLRKRNITDKMRKTFN